MKDSEIDKIKLSAYLDGELDEDEAAIIKASLDRGEMSDILAELEQFSEIEAKVHDVPAPRKLWPRIKGRMLQEGLLAAAPRKISPLNKMIVTLLRHPGVAASIVVYLLFNLNESKSIWASIPGVGGNGCAKRVLPPAIKWLLIANIVIFLLCFGLSSFGMDVITIFGLVPNSTFAKLHLWQLITYMFLHGSIPHLVMNMYFLWAFGADVEMAWGKKGFLGYYFLTGIVAGLVTIAFSPLLKKTDIPTVGSSGAIFGILVAYMLMFGERKLLVLFFWEVRAKYLIVFLILLEIASSVFFTSDGVAHITHVGGAFAGYLYLKLKWKRMANMKPTTTSESRFKHIEWD